MAREIMILRRLDHPNIIKLEGLITSRLSCSIYLVFEYVEHDISGLLSCPDVKFSEEQVKCYMKQLLLGLDHCHSRGVMHRDIKGANLLVNNEGVLKVADFGLANFCSYGQKQSLTSRVVTLWYRPPELLLGSTDYGASVDLWSVGCVFAELLMARPILRGRTEVEQLHKIFKLCGSPPDDYWKKSKLPHATLFKPQSCLWQTFKDLPKTAVTLIETLLSVEPYKRGSASSALESEYFKTKPYACDPSSLPKYPPSKEIEIKHREDTSRLLSIAEDTLTEFLSKATEIVVEWVQMHGMKITEILKDRSSWFCDCCSVDVLNVPPTTCGGTIELLYMQMNKFFTRAFHRPVAGTTPAKRQRPITFISESTDKNLMKDALCHLLVEFFPPPFIYHFGVGLGMWCPVVSVLLIFSFMETSKV